MCETEFISLVKTITTVIDAVNSLILRQRDVLTLNLLSGFVNTHSDVMGGKQNTI